VAKPPVIKNLSVDEPMNKALFKILTTYSKELFSSHSKLVKSPDADLIHDTRVYGRRLQSAFEIYSPLIHSENDEQAITKIQKLSSALKKLIELLGAARDTEITFQIISKMISKFDKSGEISLMILASNLRDEKELGIGWVKKNRRLKNFIDYENIIQDLLIDKLEKDALPYLKETKFRDNYQYMINLKFNDVMNRKIKVIGHPENIKDIHKMRIEAKLLRYLLEITPKSFSKDFNFALTQIKYFTESVGKLHDLDVAIRVTTKFVKNLDTKYSTALLIDLLRGMDEKRKELFEKVQERIIKWDSMQLGKKLISLN